MNSRHGEELLVKKRSPIANGPCPFIAEVFADWLPMTLSDFDPVKRSDVLRKPWRRTALRLEKSASEAGSMTPPEGEDPRAGSIDDDLRKQMLSYAQRHDIQTGLLNYQAFQESLGWLLQERQPSQEIALVWIDILNLRKEFSLWGSAGTDALVRHIAGELRSVVGPDAVLGRFSGRCFLICMHGAKLSQHARRRIQSVVDAITPMHFGGAQMKPETAAGVAFFPSDASSAEDLVRFASLAASRAAQIKSQTVVSFSAAMNNLVIHDHKIETEMRKGLDEGQFSIHYQPLIDLSTGRIAGAEALMRWNHPTWGNVAPNEFIPVAERSDLIHRIFEFGLRTALADGESWRAQGIAPPLTTVNVSAANMKAEGFNYQIRRILAEYAIQPTELEMEVTESLLFEDEDLFVTRVHQLKAIGLRVSIDDFGTRYTGFNVLKQLPLDTMKIDKCFIRGIHHSHEMRALCETIVAMAKQMKLRTVAEGIEEAGELDVVRRIGCDMGQGYLFRKPIPQAEFTELLRAWPAQLQKWTSPHNEESDDDLLQLGA
jgi:diguanylate cyclase (GGDEF)-like protein